MTDSVNTMEMSVFTDSLSICVQENYLQELFVKFGTVEKVEFLSSTFPLQKIAIISMSTTKEAQNAIIELDKHMMLGRKLRLNWGAQSFTSTEPPLEVFFVFSSRQTQMLLYEETIQHLLSSIEVNCLDVIFTDYTINQTHQSYRGSGLIQFAQTIEGVISAKKVLHHMGCVEFSNIHLDCTLSDSCIMLLRGHPELNVPYIPAGLSVEPNYFGSNKPNDEVQRQYLQLPALVFATLSMLEHLISRPDHYLSIKSPVESQRSDAKAEKQALVYPPIKQRESPQRSPSTHKSYESELFESISPVSTGVASRHHFHEAEDNAVVDFSNVLGLTPFLNFDEVVDVLLQTIQPHESQLAFRAACSAQFQKQVRLALNTSTFDVGLHELRCGLPDDPLRLSVLISKNHFPNWHSSLHERLAVLGSEDTLSPTTDSSGSSLSTDEDIFASSSICDVNCSTDSTSGGFKVVCSTGSLGVEIVSNNRADLCMLAFLEEFSGLVGQDHLFKRSLLLIRAWWVYETESYVGHSVKHYLSDMAMSIMVCAVFNQHHSQINHPLQALCLFLKIYSEYDGSVQAVTLQGVVFLSPLTNQWALSSPLPGQLVSTKICEKYWQHMNISECVAPVREDSQQAMVPNFLNSITPYGNNEHSYQRMCLDGSKCEQMGFNIVHPFTNTNMVSERPSLQTLQALNEVFTIGATRLVAVLNRLPSPAEGGAAGAVCSFFPELTKKCSSHWRPDAVGHSISNKLSFEDSLAMSVSLDKMWQNILFLNFILEGVVSESAILTASIDNLTLKGPLPVGEVGKTLTELSAIPTLSQKMKEKFGGLKRFLERFPGIFVFSNDHPFNPHVLLKNILLPEHATMIHRGVFPQQLLSKYKKIPAKKTAKTNATPPTSPPMSQDTKQMGTSSGKEGSVGQPIKGVAFHQQQQQQQQQLMPPRQGQTMPRTSQYLKGHIGSGQQPPFQHRVPTPPRHPHHQFGGQRIHYVQQQQGHFQGGGVESHSLHPPNGLRTSSMDSSFSPAGFHRDERSNENDWNGFQGASSSNGFRNNPPRGESEGRAQQRIVRDFDRLSPGMGDAASNNAHHAQIQGSRHLQPPNQQDNHSQMRHQQAQFNPHAPHHGQHNQSLLQRQGNFQQHQQQQHQHQQFQSLHQQQNQTNYNQTAPNNRVPSPPTFGFLSSGNSNGPLAPLTGHESFSSDFSLFNNN